MAIDAELGALFDERACFFAERVFADDGVLFTAIEQRDGRELVAADALRGHGDGRRSASARLPKEIAPAKGCRGRRKRFYSP